MADPLIASLRDVPDATRRFSQRVAEVLNSLIRSGALSRLTAADWQLVVSLADGSVTNAKLANMAAAHLKGRATGAGTGPPTDLTGTQATAILDVVTTAVKGLVPAAPNDATKFLDGTGAWTVPAGSGGGSYYTAPVLGNFSFVNQGAAAATTTGTSGAVWLTKPAQGGASNITQLVRAVPGATWTMVWGYRPACGIGAGSAGVGASLYDSGTGKIVVAGYGGRGYTGTPSDAAITVANFTNATTGSTVPFALDVVNEHRGGGGGYFLKVVNDGTDLRFSYGPDLDVWVEFHSQSLASFMTPDKVGFHVDAFSEVGGAQLFHFQLTSP